MPKIFYNLPNETPIPNIHNLIGEKKEYERLYEASTRTTTGNITFTSNTSGVTYNTASYPLDAEIVNLGEEGMLNLLYKEVLYNYIADGNDLNDIITTTYENTSDITQLDTKIDVKTNENKKSIQSLEVNQAIIARLLDWYTSADIGDINGIYNKDYVTPFVNNHTQTVNFIHVCLATVSAGTTSMTVYGTSEMLALVNIGDELTLKNNTYIENLIISNKVGNVLTFATPVINTYTYSDADMPVLCQTCIYKAFKIYKTGDATTAWGNYGEGMTYSDPDDPTLSGSTSSTQWHRMGLTVDLNGIDQILARMSFTSSVVPNLGATGAQVCVSKYANDDIQGEINSLPAVENHFTGGGTSYGGATSVPNQIALVDTSAYNDNRTIAFQYLLNSGTGSVSGTCKVNSIIGLKIDSKYQITRKKILSNLPISNIIEDTTLQYTTTPTIAKSLCIKNSGNDSFVAMVEDTEKDYIKADGSKVRRYIGSVASAGSIIKTKTQITKVSTTDSVKLIEEIGGMS